MYRETLLKVLTALVYNLKNTQSLIMQCIISLQYKTPGLCYAKSNAKQYICTVLSYFRQMFHL